MEYPCTNNQLYCSYSSENYFGIMSVHILRYHFFHVLMCHPARHYSLGTHRCRGRRTPVYIFVNVHIIFLGIFPFIAFYITKTYSFWNDVNLYRVTHTQTKQVTVLIKSGMQYTNFNKNFAIVFARARCLKCNLWMKHRTWFAKDTCQWCEQRVWIVIGYAVLQLVVLMVSK